MIDYDADVILYFGDIDRIGYNELSTLLENNAKKKDRICLVPVTYGGDPNAGFRIARALSHHYTDVEILVADVCKSAGTLLCIGSHRLIFGDRGELGPLDIQLSKPDEMFESMSGLDIIQALSAIETQALDSFRTYWVDIRGGSRLRTKLAADIAAKLTESFIAPIAAKIDPVTLGEHQRAMQIAYDYGERLDDAVNSLKPQALVNLVSRYPSHGFVIDRKEARTIFNKVTSPIGAQIDIYNLARELISQMPMPPQPVVLDLVAASEKFENQDEDNQIPSFAPADTASHDTATHDGSNSEGEENESDAA